MKQFIILFFVCLATCCFSQVPPFDEKCETKAWPPKANTLVPTYIVNLDVAPQQRWLNVTTPFKSQIANLVSYIKTFIVEFNPKFQKLVELVDNDLGKIVSTLPEPYADELVGIADQVNVPLGDIVLYNIFYEIFTVCTSLVSQDPSGRITHARNLDFGLFLGWDTGNNTWVISELLRPLTITVNFTRGGNVIYATTGFAGFIGVFTGVKPGVFSVSMNERFEVKGGYIGLFEWIVGIDRNQSWVTFLPRDLLDKPDITYEEAVQTLANTPLLAPCYYIVAGPDNLNGAVVTRDRPKAADVWRLGTNNTWFIVETNYDHWKPPLFIDDRITPANKCMNQMGQAASGFQGIFNVLSSKPVLNKLTVYTALIDVKTGHMEAYTQTCGDPCWPF